MPDMCANPYVLPAKWKESGRVKPTAKVPDRKASTVSQCVDGKTGNDHGYASSVGKRGEGGSSSAYTVPTSAPTANSLPAATCTVSTTDPTPSLSRPPMTTTGAHKSVATTRTAHSIRRRRSASCRMPLRARRLSLHQISKPCSRLASTTGRPPDAPKLAPAINNLTAGGMVTHLCLEQHLPGSRHAVGRYLL